MKRRTNARVGGRLWALAHADGAFVAAGCGPREAMTEALRFWQKIGPRYPLVLVRLPRGAQVTSYGSLYPWWGHKQAERFYQRSARAFCIAHRY